MMPKPPPPNPGPTDPPGPPDPVVNEIIRLVNQFTTIDARSTIVDQSVNQNIWTQGGDVTQIFDQEAIVASGDESVAAGNDATLVNSDTDITTGDVSIGNDEYNDSFNEDGSTNETANDSFQDNSITDGSTDGTVADSFQDNSTTDNSTTGTVADSFQDNSTDVNVEVDDSTIAAPAEAMSAAVVEEPADVLESDMTAAVDDTSYATDSVAVVDEPMIEETAEEQ
ncbi:hypothetical protein [Microbacterium sp. CH12i]|uniref:hypothetical protein n=1 Tax=Microbacterium sp. CH12i TaxID=1479651 RepID=UPI001268F358|nr:hypothetical protein [Microbacterium sp. CH12i]